MPSRNRSNHQSTGYINKGFNEPSTAYDPFATYSDDDNDDNDRDDADDEDDVNNKNKSSILNKTRAYITKKMGFGNKPGTGGARRRQKKTRRVCRKHRKHTRRSSK
jgi:hypothetical protein